MKCLGILVLCMAVGVGCNQEDVVTVSDPCSTLDRLDTPVEDAGKLHNEMVRAFLSRRTESTSAGWWEQFVADATAGANDALTARGMLPVVRPEHVASVIDDLAGLKREGVLDIFDPDSVDPSRLIERLRQGGKLSDDEAGAIERFLAGEIGGADGVAGNAEAILLSRADTPGVRLFLDVYQSSDALWTLVNAGGANAAPSHRDRLIRTMDALGALSGSGGGRVGSVLMAFLFSTMFAEDPPADIWGDWHGAKF